MFSESQEKQPFLPSKGQGAESEKPRSRHWITSKMWILLIIDMFYGEWAGSCYFCILFCFYFFDILIFQKDSRNSSLKVDPCVLKTIIKRRSLNSRSNFSSNLIQFPSPRKFSCIKPKNSLLIVICFLGV